MNLFCNVIKALAALAFVCGCGREAPRSSLAQEAGEAPLLGMGYSSTDARVTGSRCFQNLPVEVLPGSEATVEMERNLDFSSLSKLIDASVEVGVPVFPGIAVKGRVKFAEDFAASAYAETFVVHFRAVGERSRVYFADSSQDVKPSPALERLSQPANPDAIRSLCGDRYVSKIDKGIDITAALKIEFANSAERHAYGGGLGAEILGGIVSVNLDLQYEKMAERGNAKVTLAVTQRGGDASLLLEALPAAEGSAAAFLQCSYETRHHCYEVMRSLIRALAAMAKGPLTGRQVPVGLEVAPYPAFNKMRLAALEPEEEEVLAARRRVLATARVGLMQIYGDASFDRRRAGELLRGLGLDLAPATGEQLSVIEARADTVAALARQGLGRCWDQAQIREDEGVEMCRAGAEALRHRVLAGDLLYERGALNPDPQNLRSWCFLAYYPSLFTTPEAPIPEIISPDERKTLWALVKEAGQGVTKEQLGEACRAVEAWYGQRTEVSLEGMGIASTRPLAALPHLTALNLSNNFVSDPTPLKDLVLLKSLNLTRNYIRSLTPFAAFKLRQPGGLILKGNFIADVLPLATGTFPWSDLDLSQNLLTQIVTPIQSPDLRRLDLSGNSLAAAVGLESLDQYLEFELTLCSDRMDRCPFPETETRRCLFRAASSSACRRRGF